MSATAALATAVVFLWLGMVVSISFMEAPLKFRAPGVTVPIGLGIGRLVFRGLNALESVAAIALVGAVIVGSWPSTTVLVATGVAVGVLAAQLLLIRPVLTRRSDAVLAGTDDGKRSRAHLVYIAAEVLKVGALIWAGVALLS
ncbi:hypothetical protein [Gordonia soli]|uniref:DUF4149 domain-containing protein n=1 Tax=Gordonia soli NBRC 108243 TaxID=1223545 RepID=M0QNR7_9ACTN|nr:hypothetical protein [Gordonia soli]GAC69077.1 hypothetical protein GS4_20_01420 [Gordonia soli NBRC 108243]